MEKKSTKINEYSQLGKVTPLGFNTAKTFCLYLSAFLHIKGLQPRKISKTTQGMYFVYDNNKKFKKLCKKFNWGNARVSLRDLGKERMDIKKLYKSRVDVNIM